MGSYFRHRPYLVFVGPAVLIMAGVTIYPMIFGLRLSFMRYNLVRPWVPKSIVGFRNFIDFFEDEYLLKAAWVTLKFAAASISIQLVNGIMVALAICGVCGVAQYDRSLERISICLDFDQFQGGNITCRRHRISGRQGRSLGRDQWSSYFNSPGAHLPFNRHPSIFSSGIWPMGHKIKWTSFIYTSFSYESTESIKTGFR